MLSLKSAMSLLALSMMVSLQSTSALNVAKPELSYSLKCFHGLEDCSLIESLSEMESFPVSSERGPGSMIKKRSADEEADSKLQKAVKKFFASNGEARNKVFKTEEINCLTGDCRVLTAKINKRARNFGSSSSLACVGNPYSNSGSKCVPLEGLYIG